MCTHNALNASTHGITLVVGTSIDRHIGTHSNIHPNPSHLITEVPHRGGLEQECSVQASIFCFVVIFRH